MVKNLVVALQGTSKEQLAESLMQFIDEYLLNESERDTNAAYGELETGDIFDFEIYELEKTGEWENEEDDDIPLLETYVDICNLTKHYHHPLFIRQTVVYDTISSNDCRKRIVSQN